MLVSIGTQGPRIRERGDSWRHVTMQELRSAVPHEAVTWMHGVEKQVHRRNMPHFPSSRPMYWHVTAEVIGNDVIRVWGDCYYRKLYDPVHGWLRLACELVSEDRVLVTRWFRPRGQGWLPLYGKDGDGLDVELGWVFDIDE